MAQHGIELKQHPENLKENLEETSQDFSESWIAILIDFRMWVFLVVVAVIAMKVTVWLNSNDAELDRVAKFKTTAATTRVLPVPAEEALIASTGQFVVPATDGSFLLPVREAVLSDCELESKSPGIVNWNEGGSATWTLGSMDRGSGFFYCKITYRAKNECRFLVQLGELPPRKLTLYPHQNDFTEELIVRFQKSDQQQFQLSAVEDCATAGIEIKQIELIPRK